MKKYNRTLLVALLIVAVFATAIGGTFAWFTDSEESTGNIIKSGTLDVGMSYQTEYNPDGTWLDASTDVLFNYPLWEPGYTQVRYLKIENLGNLAFKYQLRIKPTVTGDPELNLEAGDTSSSAECKLAEVIDVYLQPIDENFVAPTSRANLDKMPKVGTLSELIKDGLGEGDHLLPAGNEAGEPNAHAFCIALHMQESAGNEYQNLAIREGFVIQVMATQYTYEEDDFGTTDYDAGIDFSDVQIPAAFVRKLTDEELEKVLNENTGLDLDVSYVFITTDTPAQAQANPHNMWHADYVVSFNKDVYPDQVQLTGNYGEYGWRSFPVNDLIIDKLTNGGTYLPAGTPVRLLEFAGGTLFGYESPFINYQELCEDVVKFTCGTAALKDEVAGSGLTMNVELRIFETKSKDDSTNNSVNEETGYSYPIGQYSYTY